VSRHLAPNESVVLFRVDANSVIGAGHLMRCIALAHGFINYGVKPLFLISADTQAIIESRNDFPFDYILTAYTCCDEEFEWIASISSSRYVYAVVLDGYQFNESYRKKLKSLKFPLIVLDDCNNSGPLYADIVVNAISRAVHLNYQKNAPNAKLLLGSEYTLLRPEFSKPLIDEYSSRLECLITFGASDVAGLSLPVLRAIISSAPEISPVSVVSGPAYKELPALKKNINKKSKDLSHFHNVSNMYPILSKAKMAISAAGGTVFELAALGVPSLIIIVSDNQINAALEQQEKGWCKVIDARQGTSPQVIVSAALELWNNESLRQIMHQKACKSAIINGADRSAEKIIAHLNLIN